MPKLLACLLLLAAAHAAAQPPFVEPGSPQAASSIPYKSVAETMAALRKRRDVTFEEPASGWINVLEPGGATTWSFAPRGHLAWPAVVRRSLVDFGGGDYNILMAVLCEGRTKACEELVADFEARNRKLRDEIARERDKRK